MNYRVPPERDQETRIEVYTWKLCNKPASGVSVVRMALVVPLGDQLELVLALEKTDVVNVSRRTVAEHTRPTSMYVTEVTPILPSVPRGIAFSAFFTTDIGSMLYVVRACCM